MANFHEESQDLSEQAKNFSRALNSLKEEIEAVDWYHQRVDATNDPKLAKILAHNRDEEIEHACMAIEWLRRNMPGWEENMRTYFFTSDEITGIEEGHEGEDDGSSAASSGDLGIGKIEK